MTTEVNDRVIARLRKLQEMAERTEGNEAEAEVAAGKLAELMARYQLEDLEALPKEAPVGAEEGRVDAETDGDKPSRVEAWEIQLATVVATSLGGKCWIVNYDSKHKQLRMVGPVDSVRTARYMYSFFRGQVNTFARAAARAAGITQNAWRRAYCSGMVSKIHKRMHDARATVVAAASTTAIVLVDRQKQAVEERFAQIGGLRGSRRGRLKRGDAVVDGWRDGDRVDLGHTGAAGLGEGQLRLKG